MRFIKYPSVNDRTVVRTAIKKNSGIGLEIKPSVANCKATIIGRWMMYTVKVRAQHHSVKELLPLKQRRNSHTRPKLMLTHISDS